MAAGDEDRELSAAHRIVVRRCTAADLELLEVREPPSRRYASSTFARQQAGSCSYLVAWLGGEPVGSGELHRASPPELKNLHVEPAHRGRGVGTTIIGAAEREATLDGRIRIGVDVHNSAALRLYLRLGYRPTGGVSTYAYEFVDDEGVQGSAVETVQYLEKLLDGG